MNKISIHTQNWNRYLGAMIPYIADKLPKEPIGAEIGIYHGYHAKRTLKTLNMKKFYLIDPYEKYVDYRHDSRRDIPRAKLLAWRYLQQFQDTIRWIYQKSEDAVHEISEPLDFVYIDGNHSFEYVSRDLKKYYPLIKPGGWIGGDDYHINYDTEDVEVPWAVDRFCKVYDVDKLFISVSCGKRVPDWWFRKMGG